MGITAHGSVIAIGICFPILGGILVAFRFYVRCHQKNPRLIDDWLCLPAWLFLSCCCATFLTGVFKNAFVEQPLASPDSVTEQQRVRAQVTGAFAIFWIASNALIKLSILFFYRRIFIGRIFSICNWILVGLSILWLVYAFLAWILYCGTNIQVNFEGGWKACAPWGLKIQTGVFCLDTFIDLFLLILPIPFVWRLRLSVSRKLIIAIIFLLGGFAFVAGLNNTIVQLVYLTHPTVAVTPGKTTFFQGSFLLVYTWPVVEIGVGLIACNLPSLSLRAIQALSKQILRGWNMSLSGIRYAGVRITLRSDRTKSHTSSHLENTGNAATSNYYTNRHQSLIPLEQRFSEPTTSKIQLVHEGLKDNISSQPRPTKSHVNGQTLEPTESGNDLVIRGFE